MMKKTFLRGLTVRLLIFHVLLVVFPVGVYMFLDTYERQLLDIQERGMVQQGRILASSFRGENLAEEALHMLDQLGTRNDARLRIVDSDGLLLADSAASESYADEGERAQGFRLDFIQEDEREVPPQESIIYQIGAIPARVGRLLKRLMWRPRLPEWDSEYYIGKRILDGPEVQAALDGRYGAATRISQGQISVTLYSAIPIIRDERVLGAVLVSRSTFSILSDLYQLRLDMMYVFLASLVVAILLTVLLARTVTVPVRRLRDQAENLLDERGKLQDKFQLLSGKDEVASLSKALYTLSQRLQERTNKLEDFIADLVHEMKNPVASILSSAEIAEDAVSRESGQFLSVIRTEARRIERLLNDLRELTNIDMNLERDEREVLDLDNLIRPLIDSWLQSRLKGVSLEYSCKESLPVRIEASPDRMAQVINNLLDNAISFSPKGSTVRVSLETGEHSVFVRVKDEGSGVPLEVSEKIFNRWYTDRPGSDKHTGLGLAIVKSIVHAYGGRVYVEQDDECSSGALFTVELPRFVES